MLDRPVINQQETATWGGGDLDHPWTTGDSGYSDSGLSLPLERS